MQPDSPILQPDSTENAIAIVLAIVTFVIIALVGFMTNILKEPAHPDNPNEPPYSFSRLQLFLWTLIIAPIFALHWGFTGTVTLNDTGLILLGISASVMVTASVISGAQQSSQDAAAAAAATTTATVTPTPDALNSVTVIATPATPAPIGILKSKLPTKRFWVDIIMDDNGQLSLVRLQQLIFTIIYATVYVTTFFGDAMKTYPEFQANAYILMGISTGSYLLGKSLNK